MSGERREYIVSHHRRIVVFQSTMATSAADAIRRFKNDEVPNLDTEWVEWELLPGEPTAYSARPSQYLAGEDVLNADEAAELDEHLVLMDEQRQAAGPQEEAPW